MDVLAIFISITFIFLAGLHFYWAIFGIKNPENVVPTIGVEKKVKTPGKLAAAFVGLVLLGFALVFLNRVILYFDFPWLRYVSIGIGVIFIIRALGDFKYVGFFKTSKNSKFSALDTRYYSPLCLLMGTLILILELIS
ncbi:DUF3995 domain-containing protein [Flagellimonas meridianipacifica]|uniref:Uncharacterized protein DUF3995 n=1 Tax=Flagellimonas meridianipacifica TaxID=1080225 RepID=A0A2T0M9E2_9FLAO|nr:DUF3995 domain-containing protein [Allomuricauda pacifica]PRX54088.1 uncharacterized protein DUF3995 [Allomuricauda pacifica]